MAVVHIWESGLLRDSPGGNFRAMVCHIPGVDNDIADSLSRFQMDRYHQLTPDANPWPTPIPAARMYDSMLA